MTARISVALASFNGAAFIAEQLRSILEQSSPVSEIVIADDGSTDGTLDIAEAVLAEWTGTLAVLPAEERPLGVTANFARAIAACTGELIALADQDDVWHPGKIERLVAALGERSLVFSDAQLVGADGIALEGTPTLFDGLGLTVRERKAVLRGEAWSVLMRRNIVTGATAMFRSELRSVAGEFPADWVHDEWLAVVAALHGGVQLLDEPTIDYRQHGGNQIGMRTRLDWATRMQRLRAARAERNDRLLLRATQLADRAVAWPEPAARDAAAKLQHEQLRSGLPESRWGRIVPVVSEWSRGRYGRYGLGVQDVVRDLIQPAGLRPEA